MKHFKFLLLLLILLPLNAYAIGIEFRCPSKVKAKENFICTIYGPPDKFYELDAVLELPTGFNLINNQVGKNYIFIGEDYNLKYTTTGAPESVIALLTISAPNVNSDFSIFYKNIKYKYLASEEYRVKNDISLKINVSGAKEEKTTNVPTTSDVTESNNGENNTNNNYVVRLDPNGGSGEEQSLSCSLIEGKCEVNLESAVVPIKEGYVFKGWGASKECTEGKTNTFELINNAILYACWDNNEDALPYLSELKVDGYEIEFSKFNYEYVLNVADDVNDINITATPINENAKIDINKPETLVIGANSIIIKVKDADKELVYTLKVIKGQDDEVQTSLISNIVIDGHNIKFDPSIYVYNITIDSKTNKLNITVTPTNEDTSYEILGNDNLKDGSVVTIKAINNEKIIEYKINIKKENFIVQYLNYILIAGGIIFMLVVYFIVKKVKAKEENNNQNIADNTSKKEKAKKEKPRKKKKRKKEEVDSIPDVTTTVKTDDEEIEIL